LRMCGTPTQAGAQEWALETGLGEFLCVHVQGWSNPNLGIEYPCIPKCSGYGCITTCSQYYQS
jgi:hypothetical protein